MTVDQITITHYILEKAMSSVWDAEFMGPCQNKEFMDQMKKIREEIAEAHRMLGRTKE